MNPNKHKWHERLLGKQLLKCCNSDSIDLPLCSTSEAIGNSNVIGLYFCFANINSKSDDLTDKLRNLYEKLNSDNNSDRKRIEIVQVVLWVNNDVYSDFQSSHRECLLGLPWLALPFDEIELKARLSRRYRIKSGVPTLVLLDEDGATISVSAQDKLLEDPHGLNFPWRPRPVDQVLKDVALLPGGTFYKEHPNNMQDIHYKDIPAGIKGFYFSANWARLSRRYRIKSGVPTLVLLDEDGATISVSAQDKLLEDPHGLNFPWRPRPVDQVLKDVALLPGGTFYKEHPNNMQDIHYKDIPAGIKGFYFSANWCPPCRAFTPQLSDMYKLVRKKEPNFEIIFISSDRSPQSFNTIVETMPWLVVPFQQSAVRAELAQLYGIRGIPTLLLLDTNGHVITMDARTELAEDPLAQNFPWKPRAVNILTERYAAKLQEFPAIVLFVDGEETELHFAESILTPAADAYYKKHNINFNSFQEDFLLSVENENYLQFLVGLDSETSDILRDLIGLDDVVPLLVGVDIPNRRFAVMEYGIELNVDSCSDFVDKFQNGNVEFVGIKGQ